MKIFTELENILMTAVDAETGKRETNKHGIWTATLLVFVVN